MREIFIMFIIILIVLVSSSYIYFYLNKTTNILVDSLEEIEGFINEKKTNKEELIKKSDDLYYKWCEINRKWSNIVLHEEIDAIETSLIRLNAKIEEERYDETLEEIDTSFFLIKHIMEKEKISVKNIF